MYSVNMLFTNKTSPDPRAFVFWEAI